MYRKGTWVTIVLIIFHELTGINAILLYSNTMFRQMGLENPRLGTYMTGIAGVLGLATAIAIMHKVGRRNLLISGHILMGLCHTLVGIFAFYNISTWVCVMVVTFIYTF